jgi:oligoendopeptidase F
LSVDEQGREGLRPFADVTALCDGCGEIFRRVDPELAEQFADMRARECLDLASRKGKAPGGYQSTFDEARRPFIFMNAVGAASRSGDIAARGRARLPRIRDARRGSL